MTNGLFSDTPLQPFRRQIGMIGGVSRGFGRETGMGRRTVRGDLGDYLTDAESRRGWALAAQDGIISTAGILLGFVAAGADEALLLVAGKAAIVAGMLTAGGAKWSETAACREAELQAIAAERAAHRLEDAAQAAADRAALIDHYVEKGLPGPLAAEVADELLVRSPLKAALEREHGIVRLTSAADVVISGVGAALGYGCGAAVPLLIAWYVPMRIEMPLVLFSVLVSLVLISALGARAGGMNGPRTVLRTLVVAAVTIGVSYVVGAIGG
jgi:VIT1/CCC1 family predicted Fe2+/Mn2+ transporter